MTSEMEILQLKSIFLTVATILLGLSCAQSLRQEFDVEKTSPKGTYRVKIEFRIKEPKGTRDHTEQLKVQFFKGQEMIHAEELINSDQYEPSIRKGMAVVEWVDDNVLRMGEDRSDQPFNDELIVSNNTGEYLKHVGISYGRYESFDIFDLAPGTHVTLHASPDFNLDGTSNYWLGYGGVTQSGRKFDGEMEGKKRKSPSDGPLKFAIKIVAK
jgi:hypothetical protein